MRRYLPTMLILALFAPTVVAGDKTADAPAIVVRAKSLDALLQNLNLVVKLIGQEDAAQEIEGLIKSKVGKEGLKGIDPTRPFGAYVRFGKALDDSTGVVLIPIADEKAVLTLLDDLGIKCVKDKDDIYTHKIDANISLYFRFSQRYLYVTSVSSESIQAKNLPEPAKALAIQSDATLAVAVKIESIPDSAKQVAIKYLANAVDDAKKNLAVVESKIQRELLLTALDDAHQFGKSVIADAKEIRFELDVNEKTKELTVNADIVGKPGSELAKLIKKSGELKSGLAGIGAKDAAFRGAIHAALSANLKKALGSVLLDDVAAATLKSFQDEKKREQAKAFLEAMLPTINSGELHLAAAILGPQSDHYALIAAMQLKDGAKLGAIAYDLLKDAREAMPKKDQDKVQLDADSVGKVKIHRFELPKDVQIDKTLLEAAGDNQIYVAFRDDAVFLAMGKDSLTALKSALANNMPMVSSPLIFDFDVARMAPLMARTPEQKKLAASQFPPGENGRIRLSIAGGASLRANLQVRLNVLEFLMKLGNDAAK